LAAVDSSNTSPGTEPTVIARYEATASVSCADTPPTVPVLDVPGDEPPGDAASPPGAGPEASDEEPDAVDAPLEHPSDNVMRSHRITSFRIEPSAYTPRPYE
jgi:hypothetical protein